MSDGRATSYRNLVVTVLGLAASAALAWGFRGLLVSDQCGRNGPACPPESAQTAYLWAFAVGLAIAIAAFVIHPSWTVLGIPVAFLAGSVWAGLELPAGHRGSSPWVGGLCSAGLLLALLVAWLRARYLDRTLDRRGRPAIGTVTDVRYSSAAGHTAEKPSMELTLRIEPQDGAPPFEGRATHFFPRRERPYPGQRLAVWFDPAERSTFRLILDVPPDAPDAIRRLHALARESSPPRPGEPEPR